MSAAPTHTRNEQGIHTVTVGLHVTTLPSAERSQRLWTTPFVEAPFCNEEAAADMLPEPDARPVSSVPNCCAPAFNLASSDAKPPEEGRYPAFSNKAERGQVLAISQEPILLHNSQSAVDNMRL